MMCANEKSCAGGQDYCCEYECEKDDQGGPRPCLGDVGAGVILMCDASVLLLLVLLKLMAKM